MAVLNCVLFLELDVCTHVVHLTKRSSDVTTCCVASVSLFEVSTERLRQHTPSLMDNEEGVCPIA